jgi:GST-like protein
MSAADAPKPSLPEGYTPPAKWEVKDMGGKMAAMNKPTAGSRFEKELPKGEHPLQLHSMGTPNGKRREVCAKLPLLIFVRKVV